MKGMVNAMVRCYSIGCPRCIILEKKLKDKGIEYEIFSDKKKMIEMGLTDVPILEVDGKKMEYKEAVNWINKQEG